MSTTTGRSRRSRRALDRAVRGRILQRRAPDVGRRARRVDVSIELDAYANSRAPLVFETTIVRLAAGVPDDPAVDRSQRRYATEAEALADHAAIVAALYVGREPRPRR